MRERTNRRGIGRAKPATLSRRSALRAGVAGAVLGPLAHRAGAAGTGVDGMGEIVLGTSAAFSGPSRGLGIELYRGATAYFEHINQQGGVRGRRIRFKIYDDGYQPDPSVRNTMKLVLEDRVFLLFGYVGTPTVTRVLPMLKLFEKRKVYMFFPFTGAQPQRQPPYGAFAFNLRASYRQETAGLVNNFLDIGRRRIGVFYQADAYGRSGWAGVRAALAERGGTIAGEATYVRGTRFTATMRSQVEILQAARPDAVICIGSYAACAAFARDAVDFGLRVPIANLSFVGSENLVKLLKDSVQDSRPYTDLLVNSQVVPSYENLSIPAVREYRELMARHDPQPPAELVTDAYTPFKHSFVSFEGFLNAKLLAEVLRNLDDPPSRQALESAVFAVQDFDIGVGELISFSPERRQGMQRVYYTVVDGDGFVALEDWEAKFAQV